MPNPVSLGALQSTWHPPRRFFVISGIGILLWMIIFGGILVGTLMQTNRSQPWSRDAQFGIGVIVLLFLFSLAVTALWLRLLAYRIEFCEGGLRLHHSKRRVHEVLFADITGLRSREATVAVNGVPLGNVSTLWMRTKDEEEYKIMGRGMGFNISPIIRYLEQKTHAQRRDAITQALAHNQSIDLGLVQISATGIVKKAKSLPWAQIGSGDLRQGTFHVLPCNKAAGPILLLPRYAIWNADIFAELLKQHAQGLTPAQEKQIRRSMRLRGISMLVGFFVLLGALIPGVGWLGTQTGGEIGASCQPSSFLACKSRTMFEYTPCVRSEEQQYCTHECKQSADCPNHWQCEKFVSSRSGYVSRLCAPR